MTAQKKHELKVLLKNLNISMLKLEEFWLNNEGEDIDQFLVPKYPFAESFDDIERDVGIWVDDATNKLNS